MIAGMGVTRFKAAERFVHWLHFLAYAVLLVTGIVLYVPWLSAFTVGAAGLASRLLHRIFAVIFMVTPVIYLIFSPSEFFENLRLAFSWGADDWAWFRAAWGYYARGEKGIMPEQGKFNTGQKLNGVVQVVGFFVFAITGLIMWFGKGAVPPGLYQWSVFFHDLAVIATVCLFTVHLYLVAIHPVARESITAMVTGTVSDEYAKEHHGKWYEEVKRA
ncbi:MAG: formate dehydrogenase subunit gamma [Anaerolineae bacterium]